MKSDEKPIRNASWLSLSDDEKVKAWSHPSVYPYVPVYLLGVAIILTGLLAPFIVDMGTTLTVLTLALIPVGLLLIGVEYVRYVSVFYIFTSSRIIRKRGIFRQKVRKVSYNDIDKVQKDFPIIGRILGFGNLIVVTASPSDEDIKMDYLPDLSESTKIINDYRTDIRRGQTADDVIDEKKED